MSYLKKLPQFYLIITPSANHVYKKTSFSHAKIANELPCWKLNYHKIFMQNIPI